MFDASSSSESPIARSVAGSDPLAALPAGDMWVFAYGSLMWRPDFAHTRTVRAHIHGYHRDLCVWSWVHRGSRAHPGLVLGLDRGGSCVGIAHRVEAAERDAVIAKLYARELVTNVYVPVVRSIRIDGEGVAPALAFVVDRRHPQYARRVSPELAASTVRRARGTSGANIEYFNNTLAHLDALGIACPRLGRIRSALERAQADGVRG